MKTLMQKIGLSLLLWIGFSAPAWANNLQIRNVSLEDRDQAASTIVVEFDITWDNSCRNTTNHDAASVILKVVNSSSSPYYCHGNLKLSGRNPKGTSVGSNSDLEIYIPTDKKGAFIRRKSTGSGTATSQNVRLVLEYSNTNTVDSTCTLSATSTIQVKVVGVEMVFIPTGEFDAGTELSHAHGPHRIRRRRARGS